MGLSGANDELLELIERALALEPKVAARAANPVA
jgi:hypothetical protein